MLKFIYVYHGEFFSNEFKVSNASIKKLYPDSQIVVVSDYSDFVAEKESILLETTTGLNGFFYKIFGMSLVEESKFIFLDTDTILMDKIDELEAVLDFIPIAGVADPLGSSFTSVANLKVPKTWSLDLFCRELNSGVLLINRNLLPSEFFDRWIFFHEELCITNSHMTRSRVPDQPSLMRTLHFFQIYPYYLGSEYNFRPYYFQLLNSKIKISHRHASDYLNFEPKIVNSDLLTLFTPFGLKITVNNCLYKILFKLTRVKNRFIKTISR
jgi:lipopolysaccharide biosynthesis glycosyltransferase